MKMKCIELSNKICLLLIYLSFIIVFICCSNSLLSNNSGITKRYDIYKTTVENDDIVKFGVYNFVTGSDSSNKILDAYQIENMYDFERFFWSEKYSYNVDSSFFDEKRIIAFPFSAFGGDEMIGYTYYRKEDTLFLKCEIKEFDNDSISVNLAIPYIVAFILSKLQ